MSDRTRPAIDFGTRADDYARHRPGFPPEAFEWFTRAGVVSVGERVLDLGSGTGTLARGFAEAGATVCGIEPSPGMIAAAVAIPRRTTATGSLSFVRAWAEALPIADRSCHVVCAGQCWHWFERSRAASEVARVLAPGGRALIAYYSYRSEPGTLGHATDELVLRFQPGWEWAHKDGRYPAIVEDLAAVGLATGHVIDEIVSTPFTHASWRGRFRVCNGVLTLPAERAAAFDRALAEMLAASWPEPLRVEHRVWAIVAHRADER